jgi:hypothetical protein
VQGARGSVESTRCGAIIPTLKSRLHPPPFRLSAIYLHIFAAPNICFQAKGAQCGHWDGSSTHDSPAHSRRCRLDGEHVADGLLTEPLAAGYCMATWMTRCCLCYLLIILDYMKPRSPTAIVAKHLEPKHESPLVRRVTPQNIQP